MFSKSRTDPSKQTTNEAQWSPTHSFQTGQPRDGSSSLRRDEGSSVDVPMYQSSDESPRESKSPRGVSATLAFLKKGTDKKTKEPKRRGPKPNSKPAVSRRQELNRQAQRTHRERKEIYIKALEIEVMRLKESFTSTIKDKVAAQEENKRLRQLLEINRIPYDGEFPQSEINSYIIGPRRFPQYEPHGHLSGFPSGSQHDLNGHISGHPRPFVPGNFDHVLEDNFLPTNLSTHSPATTTSTPTASSSLVIRPPRKDSLRAKHGHYTPSPSSAIRSDFDTPVLSTGVGMINGPGQFNGVSPSKFHQPEGVSPTNGGIVHNATEYRSEQEPPDESRMATEFLLAVEESCHDHQQYQAVNAAKDTYAISGHALMGTCPPASHIAMTPDVPYKLQLPDIPAGPLADLLGLSGNALKEANVNKGEIMPVQAWHLIRSDERYSLMDVGDFELLKTDLQGKSRCYGFGAVLDVTEVRLALNSVLAAKFETMAYPGSAF